MIENVTLTFSLPLFQLVVTWTDIEAKSVSASPCIDSALAPATKVMVVENGSGDGGVEQTIMQGPGCSPTPMATNRKYRYIYHRLFTSSRYNFPVAF